MIDGPAAFLAWLGAALIVLSDGRRGLALGLGLMTLAFTALTWSGGQKLGAAAILAGGAVALVQRLRSGEQGWGLMPPGSTSRLVLCIGAGLVALWFGASITSGSGAPLRFASLAVLALMGARALVSSETPVVLAAVAALALALAAATGAALTPPGPSPYILGALIAAGIMILPLAEKRAT